MSYEIENTWRIREEGYNPKSALLYESLFSLGNGYMGARGFHPEEPKEAYEAMVFIAGVFDYIKPGITDFVNTPNLFYIRLCIDGTFVNPFECKILEYTRELDMKTGVMHRRLIIRDSQNRDTLIEYSRFFSLFEQHLAVSKYKVTPLNYSGSISITAGIDGNSSNNPIPDDQMKSDSEIIALSEIDKIEHYGDASAYVEFCTKVKKLRITEALQVVCSEDMAAYSSCDTNKVIGITCQSSAIQGKAVEFDVFTAVYTSRDRLQDIERAAKATAAEAAARGYVHALIDTAQAWAEKWDICDIQVHGDSKMEQGLRYNMFQLICSNSQQDDGVSIGARGLTHSRYKGCYFWDTEIFMLPFFVYTCPEAARNLLMFRYNTLKTAEQIATAQNLEGARYPWMCNTDGAEQCETWDIGFSEVHVTADVAYAVDHYTKATGDRAFYLDYGAEILIKTARYWASRFTYDEQQGIYNMLNVKGPNEYGGVTLNNTYTTLMALHNLQLGKSAIEALKIHRGLRWMDLKLEMGFEDKELDVWDEIMAKAKVNYDRHNKLYIEDDNFYKLEPLDIKACKDGENPLYKKICFDRLQRYRVIKQADVILLMCLLPDKFDQAEMKAAWEAYEPITLHDSSLSYGTHAQLAAWLGLQGEAYEYLMKSLRLDMDNVMGNTGREGIHLASSGAGWQAFLFGLCGLRFQGEEASVKPNLPEHIKSVQFKVVYKGASYKVEIENSSQSPKSTISVVD